MSAEEEEAPAESNGQAEGGALAALQEKVEKLYLFRDRYFENHSLEDAINKNSDVEKEMISTVESFDSYKDVRRAQYFYLKGRALNVSPKYSREAEQLLSKAIKLDPKLTAAWNELGECYWKNDNFAEAKTCFNGVLSYDRKNKVSLRNLSMLCRQEATSSKEEQAKKVEEGLRLAKEAVQLDTLDGTSWAILGNAHLASFFVISQNPKTLKSCMSAYLQAEKDIVARSNPDLHYNKGVTLKYEEEYKLALESFNRALALDPTWDAPDIKERQLIKYLDNICDLVSTSGKMKAKRLQQTLNSISSKQLGPYAGGSYTSAKGQTVKLEEACLADLKAGINEEKVVLGKVVCSVHNEEVVPFTFCMVDKRAACVAVSVYNLAKGRGYIIGDAIAIPEPYITDVDFSYKNKTYKFRLVRVETPLVLVINGKKANRDQQAGVQMSVFKKTE